MTQIQLFKPIFSEREVLAEIHECLSKGWTGLGFKTIEFENEFKLYTGVSNAHFLNSATSGLHLALEIIKKKTTYDFGSVATTPLTFVATNHVVKHAGLTPDFMDIDESLCMDPVYLDKYLSANSNTLAVIFVGVGGNIGEFLTVVEICRKYEIPLILDAAHMMGTYINNKHVGNEGQDFTVFSFQSVKNLPTADSGMLVCKDPEDDKLARKLSWLGIDKDTYTRQNSKTGNWDYDVVDVGWKYHGNSIMAAIGLVELRYLEASNTVRRVQALRYLDKLHPSIYRPIPIPNYCTPSRHLFQVRVKADHRDKIISYARDREIQLGVHYKSNTEYRMYLNQRNFVPVASQVWQELISLPIGPHLSGPDIERVIEVLNAYPF